jgi:hypothetical protein
MKSFNIPGLSEDSQSGPKENSQKVTRLKWTDSAIRLLIDLRIKLDSQFKSTTAKKKWYGRW